MKSSMGVLAALASAMLFGAPGSGSATELRGAPGSGAPSVAYTVLYTDMQQFLPEETDGQLTLRLLGPEIVDLRGMKSGLDSGLVEVGQLLPLYFPSDLPNFAATGDFALLGRDAAAMSAAVTEFMVTCEECQKEMSEEGYVFTGSHSTDPYVLLTTTPIRTLADLRGKRLRSGGAPFSRWAESAGATPVAVPYGDVFESMSQGVIDGAMISVNDLYSMRLVDVTKYVTEIPIGVYSPSGSFVVKKDIWEKFSAEQRSGFIRAADRAAIKYVKDGYVDAANGARERAKAAGVEFIEPSQDLVDHNEQFAIQDLDASARISIDLYGISNVEERNEHFKGLLSKWESIMAELQDDPNKIAEARYDEIWSKVDVLMYGQ